MKLNKIKNSKESIDKKSVRDLRKNGENILDTGHITEKISVKDKNITEEIHTDSSGNKEKSKGIFNKLNCFKKFKKDEDINQSTDKESAVDMKKNKIVKESKTTKISVKDKNITEEIHTDSCGNKEKTKGIFNKLNCCKISVKDKNITEEIHTDSSGNKEKSKGIFNKLNCCKNKKNKVNKNGSNNYEDNQSSKDIKVEECENESMSINKCHETDKSDIDINSKINQGNKDDNIKVVKAEINFAIIDKSSSANDNINIKLEKNLDETDHSNIDDESSNGAYYTSKSDIDDNNKDLQEYLLSNSKINVTILDSQSCDKSQKRKLSESSDIDSDKDDQVKHQKLQPMGFANPLGYCYLNSVIQILGSCKDFRNDLEKYNWEAENKNEDSLFVKGFFNLIKALSNSDKDEVKKSLKIVQCFITENSGGDDVYKCFMNILTRISNVLKTNKNLNKPSCLNLSSVSNQKADANFKRFQNRNPGFVFDNFYGQLAFQTICHGCKHICNESYQMMKSLALPVPNSTDPVTLKQCIDIFLNESDIEMDEPMSCNCESGKSSSLKSVTKISHAPKYLFIYLNRGSYNENGTKNDTNVKCDLSIKIETTSQILIIYDLIGVIDHVGDSSGGHYYCKCNYEEDKWWLLNDTWVDELNNVNKIVTKNAIVFLFKHRFIPI